MLCSQCALFAEQLPHHVPSSLWQFTLWHLSCLNRIPISYWPHRQHKVDMVINVGAVWEFLQELVVPQTQRQRRSNGIATTLYKPPTFSKAYILPPLPSQNAVSFIQGQEQLARDYTIIKNCFHQEEPSWFYKGGPITMKLIGDKEKKYIARISLLSLVCGDQDWGRHKQGRLRARSTQWRGWQQRDHK